MSLKLHNAINAAIKVAKDVVAEGLSREGIKRSYVSSNELTQSAIAVIETRLNTMKRRLENAKRR